MESRRLGLFEYKVYVPSETAQAREIDKMRTRGFRRLGAVVFAASRALIA